MKGIISNMSCTSYNSTSIISSNMELLSSASSSTSSSCSSIPSSFVPGGRAIDRHNPIITDEKRSGTASTPTTPCANTHPIIKSTPSPKPKSKSLLGRRERIKKNTPKPKSTDDDHPKPSDLIMKAACTVAQSATDYISPPESSRYLLDESSSFIEVLSDFDPVLTLVPPMKAAEPEIRVSSPELDIAPSDCPQPGLPESSSGSSDQVVVLRVSLHCRGCERKMKKHLSRMPGVKSFNIDFSAKKVTVVGDVTPLQVLTSISKVKNAQLLTPPVSSSSRKMEPFK